MRARSALFVKLVVAGCTSAALALGPAAFSASAGGSGNSDGSGAGSLTATVILSGDSLLHSFSTPSGTVSDPLSHPDDITRLGNDVFVGFQNGVGPNGEPTSDGNADSTVVEMTMAGQWVAQWDVRGKVDGLTADPTARMLIATVNEDSNSSLDTIAPGGGGGIVTPFTYDPMVLPHGGGTDAISVLGDQIFVSASNPGPSAPQPLYPAVYSVTLDTATSTAHLTPLFSDMAFAQVANTGPGQGQNVQLGLTDPDSNEIVPTDGPRFAGRFMLTSQGDQQQIFVERTPSGTQQVSVLNLTQSVDDTAWPSDGGVLYATDSTHDRVDVVTGDFGDDPIVGVTPCGANSAPTTCGDTPPTPDNSLGSLDPWSGNVTMLNVGGADLVPQGGLLFVDIQNAQGQQGQS